MTRQSIPRLPPDADCRLCHGTGIVSRTHIAGVSTVNYRCGCTVSQRKEGDDVSDVLKETERLCEAIDAVRFCLDCDLAQAEDREDEYDDTDKEIHNATEQVLSAAS